VQLIESLRDMYKFNNGVKLALISVKRFVILLSLLFGGIVLIECHITDNDETIIPGSVSTFSNLFAVNKKSLNTFEFE